MLTIDELVRVIKFYLKNPDNKTNIRELFRNLQQLDLHTESTVPLHEREINSKKATTNGTMELAVEEWESRLLGNDTQDKSAKKGKKDGKGKSNREKYLKYKAKYLALKTKLGL